MYGTEFLLLHGTLQTVSSFATLFFIFYFSTDVSLDWILLVVFSSDFFPACLFTLIALFDVPKRCRIHVVFNFSTFRQKHTSKISLPSL